MCPKDKIRLVRLFYSHRSWRENEPVQNFTELWSILIQCKLGPFMRPRWPDLRTRLSADRCNQPWLLSKTCCHNLIFTRETLLVPSPPPDPTHFLFLWKGHDHFLSSSASEETCHFLERSVSTDSFLFWWGRFVETLGRYYG